MNDDGKNYIFERLFSDKCSSNYFFLFAKHDKWDRLLIILFLNVTMKPIWEKALLDKKKTHLFQQGIECTVNTKKN